MEIGSKNREFEKSKVASNQTCFTVEWFYKIQEGRQQGYITLVNVRTVFIYQQIVHLKRNKTKIEGFKPISAEQKPVLY